MPDIAKKRKIRLSDKTYCGRTVMGKVIYTFFTGSSSAAFSEETRGSLSTTAASA
jgi:hypothetical protein